MGIELKPNSVNQIAKGTTLFLKDESVNYVCMIIKGRVRAKSSGTVAMLTPGCFIGINDFFQNNYLCDYVAVDDLAVFAFDADKDETIDTILGMNKDYGGIIVYFLSNYLNNIYEISNELSKMASSIHTFVKIKYKEYVKLSNEAQIKAETMPQIAALEKFSSELKIDENMFQFYLEGTKIPIEVQKTFYSYSKRVVSLLLRNISSYIEEVTEYCSKLADYVENVSYMLLNDGEQNLFRYEAILAIKLRQNGKENTNLTSSIDEVVEQINNVDAYFIEKVGRNLKIDRSKVEQLYYVIMTGNDSELEVGSGQKKIEKADTEYLLEVKGTLGKILRYGGLDETFSEEFTAIIERFLASEDRLSIEDDMRLLKRKIAGKFFTLYENVFLAAYGKHEIPLSVELFLNFGLVDERLLTEEQILYLSKIQYETKTHPCEIYTIREWLTLIYEGRKEPSKTEFDLDYTETLRSRRKHAEITEEQEKQLSTNLKEKLVFEIHNMFCYTNRIVNGQLSTYVPVLHKDMFMINIDRSFLSKIKLQEIFLKVLSTDYSIFMREVLYYNKELRIEKEYIVKEVFPEMILLPTVGCNGSMWQETTGKRKDTPGRFLFPMFFEATIEDLIIKLFGRFRWEICRSIQGAYWNNIKYKSLTSEYMDYIQFYRKNSDLSEERKERLKAQIQKNRNNSREVFVMDYEAWIKGESAGSVRLNKIVREIMSTYCPFEKSLRSKLKLQPLFAEAMMRFERANLKKIQEIELRYHALQKEKIELTPELIETLAYYKEK